jgi:predicted NUDIX family phosphoesterase
MEFVFVAPREELFRGGCYPQGFHPLQGEAGLAGQGEPGLRRVLQEQGFFVERPRAERNPAWKQIIPYTVVVADGRVLLLRRRSQGSEARLHDKLSIGVGGHVNPEDLLPGGPSALVETAARREIEEELEVRGSYELRLVGFLNDDSNPVGAVHLGLVHVAHVSGSVGIREQDVLEGRLVELEDLRQHLARGENLETWSSILIAHLSELPLVQETAST